MNKNQKKKLEELKIELDAYVLMSQLVLSMMGKAGKWQKANQKWPHSDDVIYWDDLDGVGVSVDDDGNFKAFNDIDFVCPITLPKFVELIRELAPKAKVKKAKKKQKKQTKPVTYMDVFRRVAKYMAENGGYYLNVGEVNGEEEMSRPFEEWYSGCEEDDFVSVRISDEGDELMWNSVEDFLTATLEEHHANPNRDGCASIFEAVACWEANEHKLADRCLMWLVDKLGDLGWVDVENPSPAGLMKQLDDLGI